jgi:hypothetical protein
MVGTFCPHGTAIEFGSRVRVRLPSYQPVALVYAASTREGVGTAQGTQILHHSVLPGEGVCRCAEEREGIGHRIDGCKSDYLPPILNRDR